MLGGLDGCSGGQDPRGESVGAGLGEGGHSSASPQVSRKRNTLSLWNLAQSHRIKPVAIGHFKNELHRETIPRAFRPPQRETCRRALPHLTKLIAISHDSWCLDPFISMHRSTRLVEDGHKLQLQLQ